MNILEFLAYRLNEGDTITLLQVENEYFSIAQNSSSKTKVGVGPSLLASLERMRGRDDVEEDGS